LSKLTDAIEKKAERYLLNEQGEFSLTAVSAIVGGLSLVAVEAMKMDWSSSEKTLTNIASIIGTVAGSGIVVGARAAIKK
jgi:hypothetical protein